MSDASAQPCSRRVPAAAAAARFRHLRGAGYLSFSTAGAERRDGHLTETPAEGGECELCMFSGLTDAVGRSAAVREAGTIRHAGPDMRFQSSSDAARCSAIPIMPDWI